MGLCWRLVGFNHADRIDDSRLQEVVEFSSSYKWHPEKPPDLISSQKTVLNRLGSTLPKEKR